MDLSATPMSWKARGYTLPLQDRVLIMGVLNVTPDSFSDGGRYLGVEAAVARAEEIEAEGADLLDLGGESSRPGSQPVPLDVELARVLPVLAALARHGPAQRPMELAGSQGATTRPRGPADRLLPLRSPRLGQRPPQRRDSARHRRTSPG